MTEDLWKALAKTEVSNLIDEFLTDLDSLNDFPSSIPYSFEPLNKIKEKWEKRKDHD